MGPISLRPSFVSSDSSYGVGGVPFHPSFVISQFLRGGAYLVVTWSLLSFPSPRGFVPRPSLRSFRSTCRFPSGLLAAASSSWGGEENIPLLFSPECGLS